MEPSFDVEQVFATMTLHEKCLLLSGNDNWHTKAFYKYRIPSIRLSDGPNGVRGTKFFDAVPAAAFPCGTALGASFDPDLLSLAGELMALEAKAKGVHVILGPTMNIQRSPLGGRGFESFSEDPLLSGICASAIVKGIQSQGIQSTVKHFVCNDQEDGRMFYNAVITERALREIYLMPFQIVVRENSPAAFMTAYNKINGIHASQNCHILNDILRKEWMWNGIIMSDWGGVFSTNASIIAGLDLEMPGPSKWRGNLLESSVESKELQVEYVDSAVKRVLKFIKKCIKESGVPENAPEMPRDTDETRSLLRKLSADSIVLLKNKGNVLPFNKFKSVAIIGPNSKITTYCGGGSASLTPYYTVSPYEGICSKVLNKPAFSLGLATFKELPLLGDLLVDDQGNIGFLLQVFSGARDDFMRRLIDTKRLKSSYMILSDYNPIYNQKRVSPFYFDIIGYFIPEESGMYQFGVTVSGSANLYIDDQLVVDNSKNQRPGSSFFGLGSLEETGTINLIAGKKYKITCYYSSETPLDRPGIIDFAGGLRIGGILVRTVEEELKRAVNIAANVDQVILSIGLSHEWESEGFDRNTMDLPQNTDKLVKAVCEVNSNIAVVIQSGTPVSMPWVDEVPAIVQAWYGGNETGNGIADILFGDVNPSGKLSLSYPHKVEDNPAFLHFKCENGETLYSDDVYVGYRYYESVKLGVLFPFGFGLSYTEFVLKDLEVKVDDVNDNLVTSITVSNTGKRAGAEVVQIYVSPVSPSIRRPVKELKSFQKVFVEAGIETRITNKCSVKYATSYWNVERKSWTSEAGQYRILVGRNSLDKMLEHVISIEKTTFWNGL